MRTPARLRLATATALLMLGALAPPVGAVGFERVQVADPGGQPRDVGIWYPSEAAATPQQLGPYRQSVALDGEVAGRGLPMVLILHGAPGSFEDHHDLALALAEAGFVVAGIDQPPDMALPTRPQHVGLVLDYLLATWRHRDRLDPRRIGLYGFSDGGFTALVVLGGKPHLGRIGPHCSQYPEPACTTAKQHDVASTLAPSDWRRDRRIAAAVIAAPTFGFTFGADGLAAIVVPVQLWRPADDEIAPHPFHAEAIRRGLPAPPDYIVVPDADHFAFVACSADPAARPTAACRDAPAFDRPAFHVRFNTAVTAFFRVYLAPR